MPAEIIGGHESDPQDTPAGLVGNPAATFGENDLPTETTLADWPKVIA